MEAEEHDRTNIELPNDQEGLLREVYATGTPVVLVLVNGGPVSIPWAAHKIDAIVESWYPGEEGGNAIADVLFGDYNPSGRLPVTVYESTRELPSLSDYGMRNRTYRFYTGAPLFRFGDGLSYSAFHYSSLKLQRKRVRVGERVFFTVDVENRSNRDGDEVVEVYVSSPDGLPRVPIRSLQGFLRIHLKGGEKRRLPLTHKSGEFSRVLEDGQRTEVPGRYLISVGGAQPGAGAETVAEWVEIY
jgi:beta-glucosidase